jgi:gluconate 2-dehydrogenase subunit 3-like protein
MDNNPATSKPITLPLVGDPPTALSRRLALQALVGSIGAGFALPGTSSAQHPVHQHLSSAATLAQAQKKAAVAGYAPEFLDRHQLSTLEQLAESLVPGSTAAKVAPYLDQLIAVESPANQRDFLGALGAFDMAAVKKHSKVWTAISPAEQDALLREASTQDTKTSAIGAHFDNLKAWIAGAYYSSEAGMRELGWDGNTFHQELPGCTHSGGHME